MGRTSKVLDPDFAAKLKTIERLTKAVHAMQTHVETTLIESGLDKDAAKAEIKRLKEMTGLDEIQMGLINWAQVSVDIYSELSEIEKTALLPGTYLRMKREHEDRVKELSDLLKSLTPQQMKIVNAMNRKRLLAKERRKKIS